MAASVKKYLAFLLRRAPIFFPIRFLLILQKPDRKTLDEENYNAYNPKQDIPEAFYTENKSIAVSGDNTFDRALHIAKYLKGTYGGGTKNLGYSSAKTLHTMQTKAEGTCGDYSQIFINFCILNDIKVREWGLHDKVYKNTKGHVFNEVYLPEAEQWMFIDLHFAIYFKDKTTGKPLSVASLISMVENNLQNNIEFVHFLPIKDSFEGREYIKDIYFVKGYLVFLVTHYYIKKMDKALDGAGKLPIPLVHLLLIFKRQYYKYMLVFGSKGQPIINKKLKVIFKKYRPILP